MTNLRGYEQAEDESLEPDVVIVINGYGYVGKTTLCLGLAGGDVHSEYLPTVSDGREQPVIVEIRDTAGQLDYDRLRPLSYAGANCFICLYCFEAPHEGACSWSTAKAVQQCFITEVQHHCPDTPIVIMKNKSDLLRNEGFIHTNEDVESDCKWIKHTFEGSVFDGEGVNEMFEKAVSLALEHKETRKGNLRRPAARETMQNPSLSIGVFADVQYADKDNKEGDGTHATRRYRLGLRKIREVLEQLSQWEPKEGDPYLSFCIQLGDIIDGNGDRSEAELIAMLEQVEASGYTHGYEEDGSAGAASGTDAAHAEQNARHLYHVIGNHCLRVPRATLHRHLRMGDRGYYGIKRHGWQFLLLVRSTTHGGVVWPMGSRIQDSQDISLSGNEEGSLKHSAALEYLQRREGDANAVPYNGGLGEEQYEWIEECLSSARRCKMNVILFSHIPILLAASQPHLLMWDNARLRSLLGKYKDVVRMFVCGHDHAGGYARDEYGVHHVTMPGILETEEHSNAHAVFHLAADGTVEIEGHGVMASRTCTAESP